MKEWRMLSLPSGWSRARWTSKGRASKTADDGVVVGVSCGSLGGCSWAAETGGTNSATGPFGREETAQWNTEEANFRKRRDKGSTGKKGRKKGETQDYVV